MGATLNLFRLNKDGSALGEAPMLREYQKRSIDDVQCAIDAGVKTILLTIPTGGGKTIVAASMIRDACAAGAICWFVAHREELINQTAGQLSRLGVDHVGIIKGDDPRTDLTAPVQVISIDTLRNRTIAQRPHLIFIDEAHRALADSYKKFLFEAYPDAIIIGLTATPVRGDGQGLGNVFKKLIIGATYAELIAINAADPTQGIVAPRVFMAEAAPDLSDVSVKMGEYHGGQLEHAMSASHLVGNVVEDWRARADGRSTLCFATGIAHSKEIVGRFLAAGVRAAHVDGNTPSDERALRLVELATGKIQILSNVGIATEGTDIPEAKCIILARPTMSLALYMQMCGRIGRPFGGILPLVLDHALCCDEHGLPHEDRQWDLTYGVKRKRGSGVRTCPKCFCAQVITAKKCEECAFVFPVEARTTPKEIAGVMSEKTGPKDMEASFFRKAVDQARYNGFATGFASQKFKEKYNRWPPWAWKGEVEKYFATDMVWQANRKDYLARKAAREARDGSMSTRKTYTPKAPQWDASMSASRPSTTATKRLASPFDDGDPT